MGIQLDIKNVEFPGLFRNVAILHGNESSPQALGPLPSGIDDFDQGRPLHDRRFVRSLTSQKKGFFHLRQMENRQPAVAELC
jgi:hypothetical protein